ncbi:glycosyltransferase family 4 protein [Thiococcus pfennigii]|uniref:glycosyltransferase family 4 protein n=1 Tax=Thiococcus pfennigii TaxID=1057 RepID=UPI001903728B|nr:glycosyltransferase family 4 protein [Thiococcus pfennigii]MBK1699972.1 glycosyl transferase [Thiococcus pfennigii]
MKPPFLYALHSGNLYGTERMALATLAGLQETFAPRLLAPPGPVQAEAQRRGLHAETFAGPADLARHLHRHLAASPRAAFAATGVVHSLAFLAVNAWHRRPTVHLHLVHGGTDERLSYGRKRLLNQAPVTFVAVSAFVRERLLAHRVRAERIRVIENFLDPDTTAQAPRRAPFDTTGVRRVAIVSRVDPIKRIDLLLDCLDRAPSLATLDFRILGTGWDLERLRERAARTHPNITFVGFSDDVAGELARADLLLHLCPAEPFGLAILEAMAAGLPVLVPDRGGAGALIEDGISGRHFRADDAADLARVLAAFQQASAKDLDRLVAGGDRQLATRFSAQERLADYRALLAEVCA